MWVVLTASSVMVGVTEGAWALLQTASAALFIGLLLHIVLIRPEVRVNDEGVAVVNPLQEVEVAWESIDRIDTKWGLTIFAGQRKVQAWSAPAPGRHSSLRSSKFEGRHLPESTYLAGTIRPGDLISSDSGAAAYTIRAEWERRRDLGPLVGESKVSRSWNVRVAAGLAGSLIAAVLLNLN
jgi:hypothetical protein